MQRKVLYAPWRTRYARTIDSSRTEETSSNECIFCKKFSQSDDTDTFILRRFKHNAILLNMYPYNAGHVLIVPFAHQAHLHQLSPEAYSELMLLLSATIPILETILDAHGINVGINLGKAAGAGIPSHLHVHILPRWNGDTNFLPTLAKTKQISFDLKEIYDTLKPALDDIRL